MSRIISAFLLAFTLLQGIAANDKKYDLRIIKVNKLKDTEKIFTFEYNYNLVNETVVIGSITLNLLVQMDNEWQVQMDIYYNGEGKEEFEEPIFTLPYQGVCEIMTSLYKQYIYGAIKDHSNFPQYDTCPLPANTYVTKDCPFNFANFMSYGSPGMWRFDVLLKHNDKPAGRLEIYFSLTEKAAEKTE